MIGSERNILFIVILAVSITLLVFVLAYIIAGTLLADRIAAEKRLEELNKKEGDYTDISLVKNESRAKKRRANRKKSNFAEKLGNEIYKELQSADIKMRPEEFLLIWILLAFVPSGLVSLFLGKAMLAIILVIAGLALPIVYVKSKQKSRVKKFEEQFSDALQICCSCLRSGLSFTQAMETIAKDMDAPVSTEFALTLKEMNMGYSIDEALENLGMRIKSPYVELMVSAVLVQRQTGGNLSRILENIAGTIREKMKLKKQLKTATASGKSSGLIVGMMPIIILGMFTLINYDFVKVLYTEPRGNILLAVAAGLELLAFVAVKRITTIKM